MRIKIFIIILLIVTSCGKPLPKGNFNAEAWQADALGCRDLRKNLLPGLESIKEQLKGVTEKDLRKLLGKPEATSLTDQSERIYIYYLEPGAQCQDISRLSAANKLLVRISSLGWVTELSYESPVAY